MRWKMLEIDGEIEETLGDLARSVPVVADSRYNVKEFARITAVTPNEAAIATAKQRFGWKAFATNASHARLSLTDAVLCYRNEYRVERIFHRLKSRLDIAPLFVKRDDQIIPLSSGIFVVTPV